MENVNLDYLKKQWKEELGYYWNRALLEIDEYFEMIKNTLCIKAKSLKKKTKKDVLNEFSLDEERLKDTIFIPEILKLLYYIKKNNYDVFPYNFVSDEYNHREHASYIWHSLIPEFEKVAHKVIDFKIIQFNSQYKKPKLEIPQKTFITKDFEKYGLIQYESFLDLVNSIAYHEKFYVILPNLLRTLFENIIYDILKTSLNDKHKNLYFIRGRVADFSVLIEILNQLSQLEFKESIRSNINPNVIRILKDIKKIGNLSVHEVLRKISNKFADNIHDEVDLVLEALLVSHIQLSDANIKISTANLEKIKVKIGLKHKPKESVKKETTTITIKQKDQIKKGIGYFQDLLSRFEETKKPENDNNFKDNINYRYLSYNIKDNANDLYLTTDETKHLIIQAAEELKKLYVIFEVLSFNEANSLIHGYYLTLPYSKIKIEQRKISVHRSNEDLVKGEFNLDKVLQYFLDELKNLVE